MSDGPTGRILVTGSNGQLGKCIQLVSNYFPQFEFKFVPKTALDITRREEVLHVFENLQPQLCIHCAAYTSVDDAEKNESTAFLVNATGAENVAFACKNLNARMIQLSTDYVYHATDRIPLKETDPVNPVGVYARSKLQGESMVATAIAEHLIVRTSWVYSPYGKNFVKTMLRLGIERPELRVVNDQWGSPTYAIDLASAILHMAEKLFQTDFNTQLYGIYNFCNHGITNWFQFAETIFRLNNLNCKVIPVSSSEYAAPAVRPKWSVLDTEKIKQSFQLTIPGWEESLKRCLEEINN